MPLAALAVFVLAALALGYVGYGRFVARRLGLDDARPTPAHAMRDGVDFVPTRPFYLMGQHVSAIAAAGPIVGPILAVPLFGWLPAVLWIVLGVVFVGAVHDMTALLASVRHKARSVAEVVRAHLGPRAWGAILAFIWIALVYVIVAFADVTATTFTGRGETLPADMPFDQAGAVALASVAYLLLALVMGMVQRLWRPPLVLLTAIFVPATFGAVWLGTRASTLLAEVPHGAWVVWILAYCYVASLVPVWALLQPRGYLGGFVLYVALLVGALGILFGGFEIQQPATTSAPLVGLEGSLFPFLFVTIACGACSGFHGLVCSGTTSKQIDRESHCRPVGYGAMLLEGFIALVALSTILIVAPGGGGGDPGRVYGDGLAAFLDRLLGGGLDRDVAATFGTMVFATFVFDTLDVATRLGRYVLQELFGRTSRTAAHVATALTVGMPLFVLATAGQGSFRTFWVLFGTANQLLAALTLLGVTVWLRRTGRPCWFTAVPMVFVMTITVWSLAGQAIAAFRTVADPAGHAARASALANGLVAVLLAGLASLLVVEALRALRRPVAPASAA